MANKYESYAELADRTAKQLTESTETWVSFLETASRLYKYRYHEQLMIYAQRPNASACAEYDVWNRRMGRYIKRGAGGIALIDTSGDYPRLRYVFDVSDTGTRANSKPLDIWRYDPKYDEALHRMFESEYGISGNESLSDKAERAAVSLAYQYWDNNKRDITDILANSFMEEYDIYNKEVRFRNAVSVSASYAVQLRCGLTENKHDRDDFSGMFEFNTSEAVTALGTAVSEISEQILRDIEITIRNYERTNEHEKRNDLFPERRLPYSQFEIDGNRETTRQIREIEKELSEGTPTDTVQQTDSVGEAVLTSGGDRRDSTEQDESADERTEKAEQHNGTAESGESNTLDADDEQPESTGRGNGTERADLQLNQQGEQLSIFDALFPSESEQIEYIDKAERVSDTIFAFSVSQDEIDTVLRFGGNTNSSRMSITAEYMKDKPIETKPEFLKNIYHGGNGFRINGRDICAWYGDGGISIAEGRSAKNIRSAQVIPWYDAAVRIGELLESGRFAANVEVSEAKSHEYRQCAEKLCYIYHDMTDESKDSYFSRSMFEGGFPDSADRISAMLADASMCETITNELSRFADDYEQNRDILRFHYHRVSDILTRFRELPDMTHEYTSDIAELNTPDGFITEDEIEVLLAGGSNVEESRSRIYDFFTSNHTQQEKVNFLKDEYGIGGHSHALSGNANSDEWHDSKGITLKKEGCANVELSWQNVVKRFDRLVAGEQHLQQNAETVPESNKNENDDIGTDNPTDTENTEELAESDISVEAISQDSIIPPENFRITDENLGIGGPKAKFRMNMDAIYTLKILENQNRLATPEEQETLSHYVGWGGLADAFDEDKSSWIGEYKEIKAALTDEEYAAARASTLNAHYTSPTVIKAIYEAVENMGFQTGNILEPSMGIGNFFGLLPESMSNSHLYGVELDSITGRIAKQLYPNADITVAGFETTDRRDFFDLAVGNVPFGNYKVNDRDYNKLNFSIHDYFIAKAIDQVRPGGVIAFVTSRYTMDKESPEVRKYIAERAELLGAIRLPNNAFKANAGTDVVSDILFLQKRDRPIVIEPDWVHLGQNADRFSINSYFVEHPEMILGTQSSESTQYGTQDFTVEPIEGVNLSDQLYEAVQYIKGTYKEAELPDLGEAVNTSIPANPNVKNYSYTVVHGTTVDGEIYYRENSRMVKPELRQTAAERIKGMVELRDCVHDLIDSQLNRADDGEIKAQQSHLNQLYDNYTSKYGLINDRANRLAFSDDSSYYLLCSLEILDEEQKLKAKADMFTKRTIKPNIAVTSVDTSAEALALSISEKARVDIPYMSELTEKSESELVSDLRGVIFRLPESPDTYVTSDEYLSGNVREKLRTAEKAAESDKSFNVNAEALRSAQPKELDASEIEVRLGATWIDKSYIKQFMIELLNPPFYARHRIDVNYSNVTAEWNISGKSEDKSNVNVFYTYGTDRAGAYRILEDTLNLRDVRIYDTIQDADGKERRVLNSKETTLAQQKQQAVKEAFKDWIWKDSDRRHALVSKYNELFNSTRPREYSGEHIKFNGMNPEISLREHQKNAVARILYGGNTLLAHEVGAGKTFEMIAAAMESKRLGLCSKPLFAVPNHLTEQWASEFLRLYPSASILVATKKDFEPANRKKFCARIATGTYDAVIIGHSQFEKIPMSRERQEKLLQEQISEIQEGIAELKASHAERFTVKELERTRKSLEVKLEKLQANERKDDVVTFEQLGVDRLYVDEAHSFKNCFLYTKMRNVAGLSTTDSQKSSDMLMKCRYLDEITGNKGIVFATGTPVSNSMTELFTMMRYLQQDTLNKKHLNHFDAWASTFGETTTAIELAPEGNGYRARTRFAKFFNLPELMSLFKEAADIKTSDQLHLPVPEAVYHNVVSKPTEIQNAMMKELSERALKVHSGLVDPKVDNMLAVTSDGRKLGLDQRVINPDLPDEPTSKVNMCIDNVMQIWEDGKADKLTQVLFCDLSTPKTKVSSGKASSTGAVSAEVHGIIESVDKETLNEKPFSIYDDIRAKLIDRGVPQSEIAFIHDADTEVKKKELFAKVRSGTVRILLGSTQKMGAGSNFQDRLAALHDLDAPWRPGDLTQRAGRIIRQGNLNKTVHIYRYVTENSFDSYLWQTLENKQKFISQIMTSKSPVRACDDIDEATLSYAEVKALCAGDSRIKEKMDLDIEVARLKLLKSNHQSRQFRMQDDILKHYPEKIESYTHIIEGLEADGITVNEHPHPKDGFAGIDVKGSFYAEKESAGNALLEAVKDSVGSSETVSIGRYRGFDMSVMLADFGRQYVLTLKGEVSHHVELGKDARGNLIRMDNVLNQIPLKIESAKGQLENVRNQLETAKSEVEKPFPQEDELRAKSARLVQLNAELDIDGKGSVPINTATVDKDTASVLPRKESILAKLHTPLEQHISDKGTKSRRMEEGCL